MVDKLERAFCNKCGFVGVPDSMGFHARPSDGEQCSYICRRTANLEIPTTVQATRWLAKLSDPDEVASTTPRKIASELANICALLTTLPIPPSGEQVERGSVQADERVEIERAIKETEYKYFGDYEMSGDQREAVDQLVLTAQRYLLGYRAEATPTEDARSRVKVLEEAAKVCNRLADEADRAVSSSPPGAIRTSTMGEAVGLRAAAKAIRARTALDNKETDRHG